MLLNSLSSSFEALQCPHGLAVLLGVFSLGALCDADRQPFSTEAQEYCYLARIALNCSSQVTRLSITGYVSECMFF